MGTLRLPYSLLLPLCFALHLSGQINAGGTFSGQVNDATGAAIANAEVKLVEQQSGASFTARTSSAGYYTFALLKPGVYSIEAGAPGFATISHKNLVLEIQQTIRQDFSLPVAGGKAQLTVSEEAPLLNTDSAELGNVISRHSMEELPVSRQNFSLLGLLVPGTNPGPVGGIRTQGNGNETQRAGAEIVADGSRGTFNSFMIDGIDDRDQSVGTIKVFPNMESIAEFKVQTGNYDAEFASGGAVVNVITRAGTNQIHGSMFEFFRNDALDARQFFDHQKPQLQQNQFGFSISGPLRRDRTFFFGDYQGLRIHSATTSILTEPTAAMRSGDFSSYPGTIYDPATYDPTANSRSQFGDNIIPPDRIDQIAKNLLAIFPLPNLPGVSNNLLIDPLQVVVQDQFDIRVDQTLSDRGTMFARYTYGRADINYPATPVLQGVAINPLAFAQGTATSGSLDVNHAPSQQATIQEVHRLTANITNELALGYTRFYLRVTPLDQGFNLAQKLGLQGANTGPDASAMTTFSLSDESGYSSSNLPEVIPQNTWQVSDTLSLTRGAHSIRLGFSALQNRFGFFQLGSSSGELDFTGTYTNDPTSGTGGSGFADFLLGVPADSYKSAFAGGTPYVRYGEYGAFVQDQWRASPRLSLTLGLRYDLFTPVSERSNHLSDFLFGSGTLALAGQNGFSSSILGIQKHNFSPRVGLAYRLWRNTVLRGAYGLYYFNEQGIGGSTRLFINDPFAEQYAVTCASTTPCLSTSTGIPQTLSANNLPNAVYQPTANVTPRVQQWNLTAEQQLADSLIVRLAYVGSHGSDLNININENVAVPGPGPVPPRQPYPSFGAISSWEPRGPSNYDALQVSAIKRYSRGLSFLAAYTWSKSLDEGGGGNSSTDNPRIDIQNPRDVSADYGLSSFDYRHRFTLSAVYELPFGRGQQFMSSAKGFLGALVGRWQATSIVTAQSGAPFSIFLATPTANTGTFTRPGRICNGNLPPSRQTINEWFDISCFVNPPPYTFGDAGRNFLIGPGLFTWDLGLGKNFRLSERLGMQFRSEFFNVFNRPNFGLPNANIGSTAAGTITSVVTNARQVQFALRFAW